MEESAGTFPSFRELYNRKGLEIFTREQGPNMVCVCGGDGYTDLTLPSQPQSLFPGSICLGNGKGRRFIDLCLRERAGAEGCGLWGRSGV